ncbi:NAD-dependent epimerase/dehydratase family protein [candidate division WOR-3 bacterium]|nr:NAD-dependent epimerase/dehydratase family protein [candidate division WOR-3 bacterium]
MLAVTGANGHIGNTLVRKLLSRGENVQVLIHSNNRHALDGLEVEKLEPPMGMVIDESLPFEPYRTIGDYGRTKARASLEVLKGVKQGLDAVIVCPTAVVGPYDFKPSRMGQFLIDFVKRKLIAYIDGAFDFVDVRDVAMGHILVCEKGHIGETYILSGERITFKELMVILKDISGVEAPRLKVPIPLAMTAAIFNAMFYGIINKEPRFNKYSIRTLLSNPFISITKANSVLGYSPRPIRESLKDTIEWFKENNRI